MISTIGIHEVRGYARQFSSIGVKPELAEIFQTEAFAASEKGGTGFADLDEDTNERARALSGDDEAAKPAKTFRFYPKVYKAAIATANGSGTYEEYSEKVRDLEKQSPISMRHIMGLKGDRDPVDPADVDAGVGHHDYPIVISSMSFGSQSEPAFRAYAEAAKAINILCVNGEGGEIRDMYGQYRKWRGQQVASGRFGVSAEMLNSSYVAEIKIGQGAKPGEGGHLPGKKVSEKVAAARNAAPGTDLISPSNNHDLYSIEDLAELIDELKTVNPDVRVSVKVPVVPNIGTIGLGIAKAGADIITLSGFEGGTGAARQHALRHVGLPSRHRHPRRAPGADGGRAPQPGRDLGRRRLPDRPRHRQAALPRRQPGRLRHPGDGQPRLHDLPRLPARHLPRRHRDPDRDRRAGPGARPEEVHPAGGRPSPPRAAPASSRRWARRSRRSSPRSATTAPRTWSAATTCSSRSPHDDRIDLAPLITPLEEFLDLEPIDLPVAEEAVEARAEAGLVVARPIRMEAKQASTPDRRPGAGEVCSGRTIRSEFPRADRRQRPRARHRAGRGDRPLADLRRRPRVQRRGARQPRVQRRLGRRPGLRRLQRLRRLDPGRGRRPGRRRQGDAGRHRSRSSRARGPRASGSTARSASPSPTAPSAAASSSRARPTRASASASPAPTSSSPASPSRTSTTAAAASSTAPTPRASPSST